MEQQIIESIGGGLSTFIIPIIVGVIIGFRIFFPKKEKAFWNKVLNKEKWQGLHQ